MPFLEVKQSGPDVPDGTYPMILTAIEGDPDIPDAPRHVVPESGPNAGKDLYFFDWKFSIDAPNHPLDGTEFKYGTSTKTGPRSKMYGLLTALLNGQKPAVGMVFEKNQLIGRQVLATVQRDESGYCEIVSFSAVPVMAQQAAFARATGAPIAPQPAQSAPQPPAPAAPAQFVPQQIIPPQPAAAAAPGQFVAQPATAPASAPVAADDLPF